MLSFQYYFKITCDSAGRRQGENVCKSFQSASSSLQWLIHITHSFIHSGDLYSASSRHYSSEALPAQSRPQKKDLCFLRSENGVKEVQAPRSSITQRTRNKLNARVTAE